jgi:hypothetical protein
MDKKQTAVEWLVNEANLLENNGWILNLINQAKEMEKQQIIEAANILLYHGPGPGNTAAEQYYKDKYEK